MRKTASKPIQYEGNGCKYCLALICHSPCTFLFPQALRILNHLKSLNSAENELSMSLTSKKVKDIYIYVYVSDCVRCIRVERRSEKMEGLVIFILVKGRVLAFEKYRRFFHLCSLPRLMFCFSLPLQYTVGNCYRKRS